MSPRAGPLAMKITNLLCLTCISLLCWGLARCSTDKDTLLPHGEQTMLDIWSGAGSQGTQQQLLEARQQLRRPLAQADASAALQDPYSRTAANEIRNLFPRLPNPDLVLYVYPHLS